MKKDKKDDGTSNFKGKEKKQFSSKSNKSKSSDRSRFKNTTGPRRKNDADESSTGDSRSKKEEWSSKKSQIPGAQPTAEEMSAEIRLNKFIANAGVCSRREADKLIEAGEIKVNGKVISELGYKVNKDDNILYQNKVLKREKMVYVLLNKPKDFITTTSDPENRKTVMQLVSEACDERIYPVGRLDRNTTGLIVLTNDGELAKKLSHPSYEVKKLYQVDIDKPISDEDFIKIQEGIILDDGPATVDEIAIVTPDRKSLGLEIHIGRNRIVRRIFEHLGYEVVRLDRVMYAGLTKLDLPRGKWRYLSDKEVIKLKHFKIK